MLALAQAAHAVIVSGDHHLLRLAEEQPVYSPRRLLAHLGIRKDGATAGDFFGRYVGDRHRAVESGKILARLGLADRGAHRLPPGEEGDVGFPRSSRHDGAHSAGHRRGSSGRVATS